MMPDTKQDIHDLWADTPMTEDDSIVTQHVKNFMIYAVGIGLLTGIVNVILGAALGVIGAIIALPLNLFVAYKVVTKLFTEVDNLVARRIRRREGNLAENLSK
jgi:Flp pilus assembly protein TadB